MTENEIHEESNIIIENTGNEGNNETPDETTNATPKFGKRLANRVRGLPNTVFKGICGTPKFIGRLCQQFHDWFWGTEEHPTHPFSKRGKFRRWFLIHFRNYRILIRTKYIKEEDEVVVDEYLCTYELVHKSEIPRDAVHVTGMKNTWHIDMNLIKRGFSSVSDNGFTAVDSYAYLKCNKIDEAMAIKLDKINSIDTNRILLIGALLFGGVLAIWYLFLQ